MQFYEKLTFLMDLTQVSNRMLSQELQVDPDQPAPAGKPAASQKP